MLFAKARISIRCKTFLKKSLKHAVEQHIPTKTIRLNRVDEPSRKLVKQQRNAYCKYKQSEIIHRCGKYKIIRKRN